MSKTKKPKKGPTRPKRSREETQLEESLTHATEEVVKTVQQYRIPIVIGIVALLGIIGVVPLMQKINESQQASLNGEIYEFFQQDAEQIRSGYSKFADKLKSSEREGSFLVQLANWMRQDGDLSTAVTLLERAKSADPENVIVAMALKETLAVRDNDAGFALPPSAVAPATPDASGAVSVPEGPQLPMPLPANPAADAGSTDPGAGTDPSTDAPGAATTQPAAGDGGR